MRLGKRIFGRISRSAPPVPKRRTPRYGKNDEFSDPTLGAIVHSERSPGTFTARIPFQGRELELILDPEHDDKELEESAEVARLAYASLDALHKRALACASEELCTLYNESHREYGEMQADGTWKEIEGPVLSRPEFESKLFLKSLSVDGLGLTFFYADGGMFCGHSVVVWSRDLSFVDVDVSLFG